MWLDVQGGLGSPFGAYRPARWLGISDCLPGTYITNVICVSLKNRHRYLLKFCTLVMCYVRIEWVLYSGVKEQS